MNHKNIAEIHSVINVQRLSQKLSQYFASRDIAWESVNDSPPKILLKYWLEINLQKYCLKFVR